MNKHTPAVAAMIAAFLEHDGELSQRELDSALHLFDDDIAQAAKAELERDLGMTFSDETSEPGGRRRRVYQCPLVLKLFRKSPLRLVREGI